MDLKRFLSSYTADTNLGAPRNELATSAALSVSTGYDSLDYLLAAIGGMSFGEGLYRVHMPESIVAWNNTIATAWKETSGRVNVFAYDWLGRQFALYKGNEVLQFSAGDLNFVRIPADLATFHNTELVDFASDALAAESHEEWLGLDRPTPRYGRCIGYRKPLFIGGEDDFDNLEDIDMDVYWTVSAPIIARAREVGEGGMIGRIAIE